jgi:uncharacterized membrane protein HdeD (DUF308 family)
MYVAVVLLFMLLLPASAVLIERGQPGALPLMMLIGKWFVFWGVGARLATAGVRQYLQPTFTAKEIFHMKGSEALPLVRELGVANFAVGVVALASLWRPDFTLPLAIVAAIFYGVAGFRHAFEADKSRNEWIAMVSDLFIAAILGSFAITSLV